MKSMLEHYLDGITSDFCDSYPEVFTMDKLLHFHSKFYVVDWLEVKLNEAYQE